MDVMNIRILKKIKKRKGSMFVEAAIVLPIFFMAILSIVLTIRLAAVEANTMECFSKVSQEYAREMYLTGRGPLQNFVFEARVKSEVAEKEKLDLRNPRIQNHFGLGEALTDPGLVNASFLYEVDLTLPLRLNRGLSFQEHLVFRGFIGRESWEDGFGFDEMEKSDNPNGVFVFPRAGERYHKADCRIIEVYPVEKILSPGLKKKYSPCKLCKSGDLPYGCKVYCFESTGKVFHKGICTTVDRYVVEIDKEEAIERGYTPCAFCGGD